MEASSSTNAEFPLGLTSLEQLQKLASLYAQYGIDRELSKKEDNWNRSDESIYSLYSFSSCSLC